MEAKDSVMYLGTYYLVNYSAFSARERGQSALRIARTRAEDEAASGPRRNGLQRGRFGGSTSALADKVSRVEEIDRLSLFGYGEISAALTLVKSCKVETSMKCQFRIY